MRTASASVTTPRATTTTRATRSSARSSARCARAVTTRASSVDEKLTWDEIENVINRDVVRSVMTSKVLCVKPDASVFEAMKLLVDNRISAVPVVGEGTEVLGMVSERDLMARVGKRETTDAVKDDGMFPRVGRCDEFNGNVEDMWKQFHALQERMYKTSGTTVSSAMHEATTVTPETPLVEATEIMLAENVARVPVVNEKGTLVGILSRGDIMRRTFRAFMLAQQSADSEAFARDVTALDASDPAIVTEMNASPALIAFCDAQPDDDECRVYED